MRGLLLVLLLVVGCADPSSIEEDLQVETTVTPSVLRTGERATVTTAVSNLGRRSWKFGAETVCGDLYQIMRPDGSLIPPPSIQCLRAGFATIEPGQRLEFFEGLPTNLTPGIYQVRSTVYPVYAEWVRVEITP